MVGRDVTQIALQDAATLEEDALASARVRCSYLYREATSAVFLDKELVRCWHDGDLRAINLLCLLSKFMTRASILLDV
jgi:hypothetical protein